MGWGRRKEISDMKMKEGSKVRGGVVHFTLEIIYTISKISIYKKYIAK